MIRCSRPMSCAVASTWPSGGRRSTHFVAGGIGHRVREVGVAAGDQFVRQRLELPRERVRRTSVPTPAASIPAGMSVRVDAS